MICRLVLFCQLTHPTCGAHIHSYCLKRIELDPISSDLLCCSRLSRIAVFFCVYCCLGGNILLSVLFVFISIRRDARVALLRRFRSGVNFSLPLVSASVFESGAFWYWFRDVWSMTWYTGGVSGLSGSVGSGMGYWRNPYILGSECVCFDDSITFTNDCF